MIDSEKKEDNSKIYIYLKLLSVSVTIIVISRMVPEFVWPIN